MIMLAERRRFVMNRRLMLVFVGLVGLLIGAPSRSGAQNPAKDKEAAEEAFLKQAEESFKTQDRNGDGFLDKDEMSASLRNVLDKFDKNRDGVISFFEYLDYRRSQLPPAQQPDAPKPAPKVIPPPEIIIIDEAELEKRPIVNRAGNLPKGLPGWFEELDMDGDGQIAMWEWRKGGRSMKGIL